MTDLNASVPAPEEWLYDAFDDCLSRMSAGEPLADCLRLYPHLADELRPMLEAAQSAQAASRVPHHAQMRSRAKFLAAAAERRSSPSGVFLGFFRRTLSTALAMFVGFVLGATGLYYASASTLPGDSLYPVKRTFEDVQIQLAIDAETRLSLDEEFSQRRASETAALLQSDRVVEVTFGGLLLNDSGPDWAVGNFIVRVTDSTKITGDLRVGFHVRVIAELRGGVLTAVEITAQEREITGELNPSGRRWKVDDVQFSVVPETIMSGTLTAGATVTARLRTLQTGDIVAVSLTALTPTPETPLPTDTPDPTREPSDSPRPPSALGTSSLLASAEPPDSLPKEQTQTPAPPRVEQATKPPPTPDPAQHVATTPEPTPDDSGDDNSGGGNSGDNDNSGGDDNDNSGGDDNDNSGGDDNDNSGGDDHGGKGGGGSDD